jgi:hypothetical protein
MVTSHLYRGIHNFKPKDEDNCEVTPCFFIFKNTKNFFYFFRSFSKKKAFKKIIFFIFNFEKNYTE